MASPVGEIKVRCENRQNPEEQEGMPWPVLTQARAIGRSEVVHREYMGTLSRAGAPSNFSRPLGAGGQHCWTSRLY